MPLKKIGGALLIMYNNLDIKCKHPTCAIIKKLCDLENHENSCQAAKCINFELCGNFVKNVKFFSSKEKKNKNFLGFERFERL